MTRTLCAVAVAALLAIPVSAQTSNPKAVIQQNELDLLSQAQATLRAAEQAGAPVYAKTLYEEAAYRVHFAEQNWNGARPVNRDDARLRANEGLWAGRAALAKARWIGTNAAIRSLQTDIVRFGGRADVTLFDEAPDLMLNRGPDSRSRIAYAQGIVDSARTVGGGRVAADDIEEAQRDLDSARKVTRSRANSDPADYLSYIAEMMARRAYYIARANDVSRNLAPLQLQRTQLAQAESERIAATERAQREEAERQRQMLQTQLAAEQANREAQQAEVERLHAQLDENRRAMQQRLDEDRSARVAAEQQLDQAYARYESAVATSSASDVESARRTVEDQQIALRAVRDREQLNEQAMNAELDRLRGELQAAQQQGVMSTDVLSQRQAELIQRQTELETFRRERADDLAHRNQLEQQRQEAIAAAQRHRQETEAQAQQMQQQLAAAQQAAQQAQKAAEEVRQQSQQTQAELQRSQEATQAELAQTRQQAQQTQAELRHNQEATQAELAQTRQQLAQRDAEAQQLRMQQELARIAATKTDTRGFIITLSSALFDTGKTSLKPGAKSTLSRIADQLKSSPDVHISVEGHTDSVGTEETNLQLSEKRAMEVRDYLVGAGVPAANVTATGKGESEPVATNKTAAGRQQNRRVELIVTNPR